jgi:hypothetical protein
LSNHLDWLQNLVYDGLMYSNTRFPLAIDLDQQGGLLAAAFTGDNAVLRLFFTRSMETAAAINGMPSTTTLDEAYDTVAPVGGVKLSYDFTTPLSGARDVAFGPQIAILTPKTKSSQCGAVAVNVIVRDPDIKRVECTVRRVSNGDTRTKTLYLSPTQLKYGYLYEPMFVFAPERAATPFLASPEDYVVEVTGFKLFGRSVKTRAEFWYD